ncbi:Gfo/Idh/MocA family protein [Neorhodopirellula lusitana]|uniref:Gfo/Idh/MocA family protein n=1 Tax=Neorhodopirellula lusitana TaxID=445327 RepID=UPI00384C39C5
MNSNQVDRPCESRRNFLRSQLTASAAVATGVVGVHSQTQAASSTTDSSPNETLRIGLVGCGGRGTGAVKDSLSINKNVKLVAMADLDAENCARSRKVLATRFGDSIDVADDKMHIGLESYKKVLDDPDIDIVLLTTTPVFRPIHVTEAVEAGKHVFAEKPVCIDPAGYRICLDTHQKAIDQNTAIVTGTQYRRQTNYIGAIEKLREGAIGKVTSATSRYCASGIWYRNRTEGMTDLEYQLRNWMHFVWLSGDQIVEQSVHNIDLMNWLMDAVPESAFGSGGRFTRPEDSEMWDSMSVDYHYPGGRFISFKCRQWPGSTGENSTVIHGSDANMVIWGGSRGSQILDHDGKEIWSMDGSIADAYKQEHKELVDSIRADKPIVELKQTADSSLTAAMGRMSAYTGKRVTWDFVTEKSTLDLYPENLTMDTVVKSPGFAVPGKTKLI